MDDFDTKMTEIDLKLQIHTLKQENAALREALVLIANGAESAKGIAKIALGTKAQPCCCTNGIIRAIGRDNEEIIQDCPRCSAQP